jgi:DNA-binding CsgD family transcriptional regulator
MAKNRNETVGLPELHVQLRIMSRLLAAQLKATTGQQEMVKLLASTGASHSEIADVLDTTPATVSVTLQRLKKKAARVTKNSVADHGVAAEDGQNG